MMPAAGRAGAVAAALLLAACATAPPPSDAERRRETAADANQRAASALARDDLGGAQRQYQSALDRGRAVEDREATARGLLNVAALLHRSGDLEQARARLLQLTAHEPPFAAGYVGRAEARLALIELQSGRTAEAARHAERAQALCAAACPWQLALRNVQAGIALRAGDLAGAEAQARAALAAAAAAQEIREQANAWRLLGEIAGERGRGPEARGALLAALELDRQALLPERIVLDLLALARLELALGERKAARGYARRAADVAEAARLAAPLAAARGLMREVE